MQIFIKYLLNSYRMTLKTQKEYYGRFKMKLWKGQPQFFLQKFHKCKTTVLVSPDKIIDRFLNPECIFSLCNNESVQNLVTPTGIEHSII